MVDNEIIRGYGVCVAGMCRLWEGMRVKRRSWPTYAD